MPDKPEGGRADPMRVVRLLWDDVPPPARGRKHSLALDDIVAAGIRIAGDGGMEAVSMRQVAAELGVGTMSLYTYVLSKAELVELMVDRVLGEMRRPDAGLPWRAQVAFLAHEGWALYHRHPWVLQANLWRFSLGPNALDKAEALYAALEGWGVAAEHLYPTAHLVDGYVQGAARGDLLERQTEQLTGESLGGYYTARTEFWERYFDVERYPVHTRIWNAGGFDAADDPFRFGLERLLDGVAMQLRAGT